QFEAAMEEPGALVDEIADAGRNLRRADQELAIGDARDAREIVGFVAATQGRNEETENQADRPGNQQEQQIRTLKESAQPHGTAAGVAEGFKLTCCRGIRRCEWNA